MPLSTRVCVRVLEGVNGACCCCRRSARNFCRTTTHGPHERRPPTTGRLVFALMTRVVSRCVAPAKTSNKITKCGLFVFWRGGRVVQAAVVQHSISSVLQCQTAVLGLETVFVYYDYSSPPLCVVTGNARACCWSRCRFASCGRAWFRSGIRRRWF